MSQTYLSAAPARVQKNFVSDYGGVCDAQMVNRVVTTSGTGNRNVNVTVNAFASGDVGKGIAIPGAGAGGGVYSGTIASFTDAQNIVVGSDISTALSSSTKDLIYGTDNISALLTFKAAFQGSTPVQLNLPGKCAYLPGNSGPNQVPYAGIDDLIVAGNGASTSGIYNLGGGFLLGGRGQIQDNAHSLRTNDANPGDSCVIAKTQPAVTISGVSPSFAPSSVFTASASGTVLTVTAVASGTIAAGAIINNLDSSQGFFTKILPYGTAGTTGVGGTGTYAISNSLSFTSQTTNTVPATYTASINTSGVMTISAIQDGTLQVGMAVFSDGGFGGTGGTFNGISQIKSQISGSAGGVGDYQLNYAPQFAVSSTQFQSQALIRVTLNSTAGLSTGDTLYLTGITGRGQLPQRTEGLKWIKVINATTIELFQWVYDGGYTSGGTGGGDRTSLFSVGSKAMMTGWINQAYWSAPYGYPSNPHWFEYRTVVSTNSTTHQICFDAPLTNAYKASWPQYNTGSQFEIDPGGPATVYLLDPTWEKTIEFKSLTIAASGQSTGNGRNVTLRDVTVTGVDCVIPTQNETHNWVNVTGTNCSIETDKIVGTWNISVASFFKVDVQSSSMNVINASGLTITAWFGGAKQTNIDSSTITGNYTSGTLAYGVSDSASVTNTSIGGTFQGAQTSTTVNSATAPWSMSGGVITIPNSLSYSGASAQSEIKTRYLVPGHYFFWNGLGNGSTVNSQLGRAVKVVSVTQDVDNTYIQTNEVGGFPTGTAWTTNGLAVIAHPSPVFTASGNTGSGSALAFNGCASLPMYSCQNFTFTGGASGTTPGQSMTLWGEPSTFTFTNNVPYTNTGTLTWTISQFNNWQMLKTDLTITNLPTETINTKLPSSVGGGTRTLTSAGATGTQAGDTLSAWTAGALLGSGSSSVFSANTPSDSPQVTVTLRTNQNLPP